MLIPRGSEAALIFAESYWCRKSLSMLEATGCISLSSMICLCLYFSLRMCVLSRKSFQLSPET